MTLKLAPPPLDVPPEFAQDKVKGGFFSGLLNTLYQVWSAVYSIRFEATATTTDSTVTALARIKIPTGRTMMIQACIVARRTGGSSGSAGDSAFYQLTGAYKNISGTLTGIGTPDKIAGEDQAGWDVAFSSSGENAIVTVTGAANNNVTWEGTVYTYVVGS